MLIVVALHILSFIQKWHIVTVYFYPYFALPILRIFTEIMNPIAETKLQLQNGMKAWFVEIIVIDFLTKISHFTPQNVGNPVQINQICCITKVSSHYKTLSYFCWKGIHFKAIYCCFLVIFTSSDLW